MSLMSLNSPVVFLSSGVEKGKVKKCVVFGEFICNR